MSLLVNEPYVEIISYPQVTIDCSLSGVSIQSADKASFCSELFSEHTKWHSLII